MKLYIKDLEEIYNLKTKSELLRYLQPVKNAVGEISYGDDIVTILNEIKDCPPDGLSREKIIQYIALHGASVSRQLKEDVKNYELAIGQSKNGKSIRECLRQVGIEQFAANKWQKSVPIQDANECEILNIADLFIKVMCGLKQQIGFKAAELNSSRDIIISKESLLDPRLFGLRSKFRTKDIDWSRPPKKQVVDFSTSDIENFAFKIIEACGIDSDAIQIYFAELPFWGLEFNLELSKKAAVISSRPQGLKGLSILMHEIGHAIDCVTWKNSFSDFFFREPALTETYAVIAQRMLENSNIYTRMFGFRPNQGLDISKNVLENKHREFAYMFVLMDLDRHFWTDDVVTLDSCAEVYQNSCLEHFGVNPPSPFGFCVEQIHYLYPNYMANYFLAELIGSEILPSPSVLDDYKAAISIERNCAVAKFLPDIDKMATRRCAEIIGYDML